MCEIVCIKRHCARETHPITAHRAYLPQPPRKAYAFDFSLSLSLSYNKITLSLSLSTTIFPYVHPPTGTSAPNIRSVTKPTRLPWTLFRWSCWCPSSVVRAPGTARSFAAQLHAVFRSGRAPQRVVWSSQSLVNLVCVAHSVSVLCVCVSLVWVPVPRRVQNPPSLGRVDGIRTRTDGPIACDPAYPSIHICKHCPPTHTQTRRKCKRNLFVYIKHLRESSMCVFVCVIP